MEKIKLTKVFTTNVDKAQNPLKTKDGKPYTRMSVKAEQYGDQWISGFENQGNKGWKEGDEVEVIIKKVMSGGKEYINFETPKKDDKVIELLTEMNTKLNVLYAIIKDNFVKTPTTPSDYPEEETNIEEMSF